MLLRSSSTPILTSMLEAPGNSSREGENHHKISFPTTPSSFTWKSKRNRRVSSESNLNATGKINEMPSTRKWSNNYKSKAKLEPIRSFSLCDRNNVDDEDDEEGKNMDDYHRENEFTFPLMSSGRGFNFFEFSERDNSYLWASSGHNFQEPTCLYMAMGLGIDPDLIMVKQNKFGDDDEMQRHYEKMVKENPCNPLVLRNYARHLYKNVRYYKKAEEFYSRAILAEPNDGEVLSEYASLRWEIHREEETASNYFKSAVQASPENSNVLGAYASFLWDIEEKDELKDEGIQRQLCHTS